MKYRVSFNPNLGEEEVFNGDPCETKEEAEKQLDLVAKYTLFLHEGIYMSRFSNAGYIEELVADEWEKIDDDD